MNHGLLFVTTATNKVTALIRDGANYGDGGDAINQDRTFVKSESTWYHICIVYYNSSEMHLYVDGVKQTDATDVGGYALGATTNDLSFGSRCDGVAGQKCYIDEAAVWSRVLSEEEAVALYNSGSGKFYDDFD
jgi:hypothetical protein